MMHKVIKALSKADQEKAFALREEVFVHEQQVAARDEFDAYEEVSHHFVALDADNAPIGVARWRSTEKGIKLERFAVKKTKRSQGLGAALVRAVLDDILIHKRPPCYLYLHAQLAAMPLYAKFGFKKEGSQFEECGIQHYKMALTL